MWQILSLYNPDNGASYGIFTPNQQTPSETVSQVFDLSNFTGTKLRAVVYDYAANSAVYDVSVGEIFGNQEVVTEFGAFWSGEWLLFNRDSSADYDTYNLGEQASAVGDVQAAADVDGKVFMVTPDGGAVRPERGSENRPSVYPHFGSHPDRPGIQRKKTGSSTAFPSPMDWYALIN